LENVNLVEQGPERIQEEPRRKPKVKLKKSSSSQRLQKPAAKFTATCSTIYLDLDPNAEAPIKKQDQEKPPSDKVETLDMGTQVNCISNDSIDNDDQM
jgi:hypothetical protein